MKKYILLIIIVVSSLLLFMTSFALSQESFSNIVKQVRPAVVTVIIYNSEGKSIGFGSGFFINKDGELITNYHVIREASFIEVKSFDETRYRVKKILAINEYADLVKLKVAISKDKVTYLKITEMKPEVGDRIIVLGSPLGFEHTVSDGIVSAIRKIKNLGEILQISAPVSPGSSGGPVINLKGEVVGVATFQIIGGQNLNFAIPANLPLHPPKKGATALPKPEVSSLQKEPIKPEQIKIIKTKIGEVSIIGRGVFEFSIKLNGKIIYQNNEARIKNFQNYFDKLGSDEAILIQESSATRAYFRLIILKADGFVKVTDSFGNGSDLPDIMQQDEKITMKFPGGNKSGFARETWIYENGKLNKAAN